MVGQPEVAMVQPSPVPQSVNVAQLTMPDGQHAVVLQFAGPCGTWVVFLDDAAAEGLARQLDEARGGIVVAPANSVPGLVTG